MDAARIRVNAAELTLADKLIRINRVAKVMKGGKRLRFSALVVTGDGIGHVGLGLGKAAEVPVAIQKASASAKKNLITVPLAGATIPSEIIIKFGAARLLLKPAVPGTGLKASNTVRAVLEAAGVKDVLSKSLGSSNKINVAKATLEALMKMRNPAEELIRRKGPSAAKPEEQAREGAK